MSTHVHQPIGLKTLDKIGAHLRRTLHTRDLHLVRPLPGQSVQVRIGTGSSAVTIGTLDRDKDGDFIVTIPVLQDELAL